MDTDSDMINTLSDTITISYGEETRTFVLPAEFNIVCKLLKAPREGSHCFAHKGVIYSVDILLRHRVENKEDNSYTLIRIPPPPRVPDFWEKLIQVLCVTVGQYFASHTLPPQ